MRKQQVSVALSKDLLEVIEEEKGLASRSAYIEFLLRKGLKTVKEEEKPSTPRPLARA